MSGALALRGAAALAAVVLARRPGLRGALAASALASFAAFGWEASPIPSPAAAFLRCLAYAVVLAGSRFTALPPIFGDAAAETALAALPSGLFVLWAGRALPGGVAVLQALGALVAVSILGAVGALASAEEGWRRIAGWSGAVLIASALTAPYQAAVSSATSRGRLALGGAALLLIPLVWLPALFIETARLKRELSEEVRLGLMPEEDAAVLRFPWKRAVEKRFGRRDERREYVRAALLLAVARAQQRRVAGEASRLRQLEVLTFRTRVRRTLDARASRASRGESGEMPQLAGR